MTSRSSAPYLGPRTGDILAALDKSPLTALQLQRLSHTWMSPFSSLRRTRSILLSLSRHRIVRVHSYASTRLGQPENYYTLAPQGYRLLHGQDAPPPTKAHVSAVGLSRQEHTRALAEAIVQFHLLAHASGASIQHFYRENALALELAGDFLAPDSSFTLVDGKERTFRFHVELDTGTERVRSTRSDESLEAKLRFYDRLASVSRERFRVILLVASNSEPRRNRILETFADVTSNRLRTLLYGVTMREYQEATTASDAVFLDHLGRRHSLLPAHSHPLSPPKRLLESTVV